MLPRLHWVVPESRPRTQSIAAGRGAFSILVEPLAWEFVRMSRIVERTRGLARAAVAPTHPSRRRPVADKSSHPHPAGKRSKLVRPRVRGHKRPALHAGAAPESGSAKDISRRPINFRLEVAWSVLGLLITAAASVLLVNDLGRLMLNSARNWAEGRLLLQATFTGIFLFLIYGNALYQFARLGYLMRLRRHRRTARTVIEKVYDQATPPSVCMLIPSYKEERDVVRQAVLSCALQDWPTRRVVLLIDDPHEPGSIPDRTALERMRQLPVEVAAMLEEPKAWCREAAERFEQRFALGTENEASTLQVLRAHLAQVADWFDAQAFREAHECHTDRLFVSLTFRERARAERARAAALVAELAGLAPDARSLRIRREYRRLARLFDVDVTSFERKRYVNLSDEPNKAMNLNSYIGLMGGNYREGMVQGRPALVPASPYEATLKVPAAEFLLTLDADSLLAHDYTLRLLDVMRAPGNERMAVIQTPYSAVPGPAGTLERVAGATTDMQYIIHQGFTACRATYWVGANALLRRVALDDIVTEEQERGFTVRRYIQDRTVIEDTESSIDLVAHHWSLYNYPERLSYSATPSDFGSLVIQRQRWANGGLIILPKLLRYLATEKPRGSIVGEAFMRFHYLTSILVVNLGVLMILTWPTERPLQILWLPLTALPYYALYTRDLVMAGYRWTDVIRVYALNLLLIPVNLAGVIKSIQQMILKVKIPFSRTPKIDGHTVAPTPIVAMQFGLVLFCVVGMVVDGLHGRWTHVVFAGLNAGLLTYGIDRFIGLRDAARQVRLAVAETPVGIWARQTFAVRGPVAVENEAPPG
jgi:cellulose synthase/poly-beta-1,6-N-acetylglucosamine synthase-like glycosyltransferase